MKANFADNTEKAMARHRIHFGCGVCAPDSWTNFDSSATLRLQRVPVIGRFLRPTGILFPRNIRVGDIVKGLPVAPESCRVAYCSHVLEHLTYAEVKIALRNVYRYLERGGTFRMVLPDLETMISDYLSGPPASRGEQFVRALLMEGVESKPSFRTALHSVLSNAYHHSHWDFDGLRQQILDAGFVDVRRASFGDSSDPSFRDVEEERRWHAALGIEARK